MTQHAAPLRHPARRVATLLVATIASVTITGCAVDGSPLADPTSPPTSPPTSASTSTSVAPAADVTVVTAPTVTAAPTTPSTAVPLTLPTEVTPTIPTIPTSTSSTAPALTVPIPTTSNPAALQLALTIHVERRTRLDDPAGFARHVETLLQLADLADEYGVIVNYELANDFVAGVDAFGSTFIEDIVARGHVVSQHSGDELIAGLEGQERVDELLRQRAMIEAHGVTVNYVSGGCDPEKQWVEAAIDAGFQAVTGLTEYCLKSLSDEALPDGMGWIEQCRNAAICHDPLHLQDERTVHPWTTNITSDWLTDDPNGRLVLVSAAEVEGFAAMSQSGDADLESSLAQWQSRLAELIAASRPGQVNVWNFVISIGSEPDWEVVEAIFADARTHVAAGQVAWADLSEVVASAVLEAPTQAADAPAAYTDVTPDLGGGQPIPQP